ncbi:hypothetical protein MNB_SV-3-1137 [hydrothermal vent metagenome]|uniref:Bacteriophage T5 Orf172 DNA-binding domain-containing protein n=1 Tax=hydrothermal vent metagenome TaxID=652676 RepID=A0A1W1BPP4_9ZZZZ
MCNTDGSKNKDIQTLALTEEQAEKVKNLLSMKKAIKNKTDLLYLLEANGNYKIGITGNLASRMKDIQTGNPYLVKLVCTIEMEDPQELEQSLHKLFKDKRMMGEWFNLNKKDVKYIKSLRGVENV